jgi:hypothetical protein
LQGTFGPFKKNSEAVVPLWLAVKLKADHRADIRCPPWLTVEQLEETYSREVAPERKSKLSPLPVFYLEIASVMFKHAADNLEDAERARQLIKDIEEVRAEKLRRGRTVVINAARKGTISTVLNLNHIGFLEASALTADMLPLLDELGKLERAETAALQRSRTAGSAASLAPSLVSLSSASSDAPTPAAAPSFLPKPASASASASGGDASGAPTPGSTAELLRAGASSGLSALDPRSARTASSSSSSSSASASAAAASASSGARFSATAGSRGTSAGTVSEAARVAAAEAGRRFAGLGSLGRSRRLAARAQAAQEAEDAAQEGDEAGEEEEEAGPSTASLLAGMAQESASEEQPSDQRPATEEDEDN